MARPPEHYKGAIVSIGSIRANQNLPRVQPPNAVTRWVNALLRAATALGVALLVWMRTKSRRRALAALLVTALLPEVQRRLMGGYWEPFAAAILVTGIVLLSGGERFFFSGVLVLSLLPLVRPNYLLVWIRAVILILWVQHRTRFGAVLANPRRLLAATLLFFMPSALWVMRNYLVSGVFPIQAGTASTTLHGNYNPVSAKPGPVLVDGSTPAKSRANQRRQRWRRAGRKLKC